MRLCGGLRDVLVGWGLVPLQLHLDLGLAAALHVVRGVHVHAPLALEVCGAVLGCCVDEVGGCGHTAVHQVCLQWLLVFAISRILIVVVVSSSRKTQPECGRGIPFPFDPPHAVVVVAVVVADVDLGRPGDTARAAVDLPQRLVQLVNDDGEIVFPGEGHNTVVVGVCSTYRESGEVRIEADIVHHKVLEVVTVVPHESHHVCPVKQVVVWCSVQLVTE